MDPVAADDNSSTIPNNSQEVNTAADLARLCNNSKLLMSQELKELNTRIKTLEEIAQLEDRLRALEKRKHPTSELSEPVLPLETPIVGSQLLPRSAMYTFSPQEHRTIY